MFPKVPEACVGLDLVLVERTLAKHHGYIPAAARELGPSTVDLSHLTWSKPKLLEAAHEEMEVVVAQAWSELIKAVYSDDPRRQMWASDKILASWIARDHPLAPARRSAAKVAPLQVTFRWEKV
jgi:hypothetical protein